MGSSTAEVVKLHSVLSLIPGKGVPEVSVTAVELDDLLLSLRDGLGVTTVLVTHELPSIFRIADTCIMLDKDERGIIARGAPRELRDESDDPRVHAFFNRLPRSG